MGLDLSNENGQTPLEEEEIENLLLPTISTRGELDEFEQANIQKAVEWSLKLRLSLHEVLSIAFIKELHLKMFSEVWRWAGTFRRSNKNLGVDKFLINEALYKLTEDCKYWIENKTFPEDEIAVRYKYMLVTIHPFPNGNGRHSRISGDILVSKVLKRPVFSWGGRSLGKTGELRARYLQALSSADQGDINPLLQFARSGILT